MTAPRAAILAVYAGFGAGVGAWAGAIPAVTRASGVSATGLGIGLTTFTIAYVIAMSLGARLATSCSNRAALLAILPLTGVATVLLLLSAAPWALFLGLIAFGAILGLLDLFMNAEASAIESDMRRPIFAAFHGAASTGMPVYAIVSSFVSAEVGPWLSGLLSGLLAGLPMGLAWFLVRRAIPARKLALRASGGARTIANRLPLVIMGLAAGLIIAGETAAIMWSARLLDEQAPDLAAVAGLGAAFFGLCNAALRYPGDRLRRLFGDIPLMLGSLLVAIAGFTLLGLSHGFLVSVLAFAIVGFGTALLIPCLFALAAAYMPGNRAAGIGFVGLVAGVPRTLAPWFFGWVATTFSTSFAFGLCAVILTLAMVLIVALRGMGEAARPA
jgi:MFS family permease